MVPFDVPAGITRVRARLCHDQSDLPNTPRATLDLGLYEATTDGVWDENEFRGWGGSSRPDTTITPEAGSTTVGYRPGPIPAGRWAAELGVAGVPGLSEGDPDASVAWRLEIFLSADPGDFDDPFHPSPYDETPALPGPNWFKGDFHVHARNSNPNDATMREVFDYAFSERGAGLDFITLSDYVGTRQWDEIGAYQLDYPYKLVIRSAEVITYRGHINNHGSHRYVDHRTGPVYELRGGELVKIREARPASAVLGAIRAGGGWTQVNHPTIFPSKVPAFALLCRGCSWEYSDEKSDWREVDAFDVQTGPAGTQGQTGQEPGPNPFTPAAIEWWDRLTRSGYRITAVGSSDSHKAQQASLTTAPIGEATTVVWADELSEVAIGRAIRAGHAYVKFFSARGPDLRFTARAGHRTAMMGDTLAAGSADFEAQVLGGAPNPQPRTLSIYRDGIPVLRVPVTDDAFVYRFTAPIPGSYRLQLDRGTAIEALTNPITLAP
jgi:hypothetical protein